MMTLPYTRRRCIRIIWSRGADCLRHGLSHSRDYDIPVTTVYLGRLGYIELFWRAVR